MEGRFAAHVGAEVIYTVRTEEIAGRKHLVVPVVMMVEGVHAGSAGPLFHPREEFGATAGAWEGKPICISHPRNGDGEYISAQARGVIQVGHVRGAVLDGDRLRAEAVLDIAMLSEVSPAAYTRLLHAQPLEVSVGVFVHEEGPPGRWGDEEYRAVARGHAPDHLALLPDELGACSVADGCGVRVNSAGNTNNEKDMENEASKKAPGTKAEGAVDRVMALSVEAGHGYRAQLEQLQRTLDQLDTPEVLHFLEDAYAGNTIYRRRNADGSSTLFQQQYQITSPVGVEPMVIELLGTPVEVQRRVSYAVNGAEAQERERTTQPPVANRSSCFLVKVEQLLAHARTRLSEGDRAWLLSLDEGALDRLLPDEEEPPVVEDSVVGLLAHASQGVREEVEDALRLRKAQREGLVKEVLALAKGVWSQEALEGKGTDELERMRQALGGAEYSPGAGSVQAYAGNRERPLLPAGFGQKK